MLMRTSCSAIVTEVSGSERSSGDSSMYITAGQTYSRDRMASQATSSSVFSRIVKAISG